MGVEGLLTIASLQCSLPFAAVEGELGSVVGVGEEEGRFAVGGGLAASRGVERVGAVGDGFEDEAVDRDGRGEGEGELADGDHCGVGIEAEVSMVGVLKEVLTALRREVAGDIYRLVSTISRSIFISMSGVVILRTALEQGYEAMECCFRFSRSQRSLDVNIASRWTFIISSYRRYDDDGARRQCYGLVIVSPLCGNP